MQSQFDEVSSAPAVQGLDLREYAGKLDRKSVVLVTRGGDGEIDGMIAFYCNDLETRRGHITYAAVARSAYGAGVFEALLDGAILHCTLAGMKSVTAESWRGKPWVRFLSRWARPRGHAVEVPLTDGVPDNTRYEIFFDVVKPPGG